MGQPEDSYQDYAEHPKYGRGPRFTGQNPKDDWQNGVYLGWSDPNRIPDTAIAADTVQQVPRPLHITHYFDVKRRCRDCKRKFIFFAEEQKYWYEELGFPPEASCARCVDCRKIQRGYKALQSSYENLLKKPDRLEAEMLELATCALTLIESGWFGNRTINRVRFFLNSIPSNSDVRNQDKFRDLKERVARLAEGVG